MRQSQHCAETKAPQPEAPGQLRSSSQHCEFCLATEPHFVRKSCDWTPEITINFSFFSDRTLCQKSQRDRSFLVRTSLGCVRALSLALPRAFKTQIEKKEKARGQESKRAREDQKMSRCEDDVRMRRYEDERM